MREVWLFGAYALTFLFLTWHTGKGQVNLLAMEQNTQVDRSWEKAKPGHAGISRLTYADRFVHQEEIQADIKVMIAHYGMQQLWTADQINVLSRTLQFGNNHPDFRIDYRIVLSYFGHESWYNPYKEAPNTNGTIDYGLGQNNSCCLRERWIQAYWLNERYNIVPGRKPGTDKFDVQSQAIATLLYLRENRAQLDAWGKANNVAFGLRDWIISYNLGFSGTLNASKGSEWNHKYFAAVMNNFRFLNGNDQYSDFIQNYE